MLSSGDLLLGEHNKCTYNFVERTKWEIWHAILGVYLKTGM